MIFPIWQPLGTSSHLLAQKCGLLLSEPATHTGTLDPMASGVLVVLTGDDRFAKGSFSDWHKTYSFSILWGVATDSGDTLGLIQTLSQNHPSQAAITHVLESFPKQYSQKVPDFSSRRWQGKSGFDHARLQVQLPDKERLVEIDKIILNTTQLLSPTKVFEDQQQAVKQITGDFRQSAILDNWKENFSHITTELLITHHVVTVSTGTYIRQLVQDIAQQLDVPATTWSITRLSNGPFAQEDCIEIAELADLDSSKV
jgi:tRNA pseudouridine(55) synthase